MPESQSSIVAGRGDCRAIGIDTQAGDRSQMPNEFPGARKGGGIPYANRRIVVSRQDEIVMGVELQRAPNDR